MIRLFITAKCVSPFDANSDDEIGVAGVVSILLVVIIHAALARPTDDVTGTGIQGTRHELAPRHPTLRAGESDQDVVQLGELLRQSCGGTFEGFVQGFLCGIAFVQR